MSNFDEFYQDVGGMALDIAEGISGRLLVYSEVDDGMISSDIFYSKDDCVKYLYTPSQLQDVIYSFWENWTKEVDGRRWRIMIYVVENGNFSVDFVYPEDVDHMDIDKYRPTVVQRYFGDAKIDYSSPE